jgi:hypothetical protein
VRLLLLSNAKREGMGYLEHGSEFLRWLLDSAIRQVLFVLCAVVTKSHDQFVEQVRPCSARSASRWWALGVRLPRWLNRCQGRSHSTLMPPADEQGQNRALEQFLKPGNPRPTHRHRSARQRQAPWLPVTVAIPAGSVLRRLPGALHAAQKTRHLFVQHRLQHHLNLFPCKRLQRLERRSCRRLGRRGLLSHGSVSFRMGVLPVGPDIDPGRLRCLHPVSTPREGTSMSPTQDANHVASAATPGSAENSLHGTGQSGWSVVAWVACLLLLAPERPRSRSAPSQSIDLTAHDGRQVQPTGYHPPVELRGGALPGLGGASRAGRSHMPKSLEESGIGGPLRSRGAPLPIVDPFQSNQLWSVPMVAWESHVGPSARPPSRIDAGMSDRLPPAISCLVACASRAARDTWHHRPDYRSEATARSQLVAIDSQ